MGTLKCRNGISVSIRCTWGEASPSEKVTDSTFMTRKTGAVDAGLEEPSSPLGVGAVASTGITASLVLRTSGLVSGSLI